MKPRCLPSSLCHVLYIQTGGIIGHCAYFARDSMSFLQPLQSLLQPGICTPDPAEDVAAGASMLARRSADNQLGPMQAVQLCHYFVLKLVDVETLPLECSISEFSRVLCPARRYLLAVLLLKLHHLLQGCFQILALSDCKEAAV